MVRFILRQEDMNIVWGQHCTAARQNTINVSLLIAILCQYADEPVTSPRLHPIVVQKARTSLISNPAMAAGRLLGEGRA